MAFTVGDYIALGAVTLTAIGFVGREWRATVTARSKDASDKSLIQATVGTITEQINRLFSLWGTLDQKRQEHELRCAEVQARTAATQERLIERLDKSDRAVAHLQAQIGHVASGANDRIVEVR